VSRSGLKTSSETIRIGGVSLALVRPEEPESLLDEDAFADDEFLPYWAELWPAGLALARALPDDLEGVRVVELGCGLAVPSIAAARAGATVLATDACAEALTLASRNARANGVRIETATVDWAEPEELVRRGPFDLVLAADVLYERSGVAALLSLLPRLAPEAWVADPGRPAASAFLEQACRRWPVETRARGVVGIHRIQLGRRPVSPSPGL
jgi:predicted nicotinamide N-methyase